MIMAAIVVVIVAEPVVLAVHVHGNATVALIEEGVEKAQRIAQDADR